MNPFTRHAGKYHTGHFSDVVGNSDSQFSISGNIEDLRGLLIHLKMVADASLIMDHIHRIRVVTTNSYRPKLVPFYTDGDLSVKSQKPNGVKIVTHHLVIADPDPLLVDVIHKVIKGNRRFEYESIMVSRGGTVTRESSSSIRPPILMVHVPSIYLNEHQIPEKDPLSGIFD